MRILQTLLVSLILTAGAAGPGMAQQIQIGMPSGDKKPRPDPRVAREAANRREAARRAEERRAAEARAAAEFSAQADRRQRDVKRAVTAKRQAEYVSLMKKWEVRAAERSRLNQACQAGDKAVCAELRRRAMDPRRTGATKQ